MRIPDATTTLLLHTVLRPCSHCGIETHVAYRLEDPAAGTSTRLSQVPPAAQPALLAALASLQATLPTLSRVQPIPHGAPPQLYAACPRCGSGLPETRLRPDLTLLPERIDPLTLLTEPPRTVGTLPLLWDRPLPRQGDPHA